jgi:DNA-binding Lrp family transcriptional regulator
MDELDLRILKTIAVEGTGSTERIHEALDVPQSTIHYRVEKMKEAGVILNDLYDVDLRAVGLRLTLISEVIAEYGELTESGVGERLGEIEGVDKVYFTLGDVDFVLIAHLTGRDMVEELVNDFENTAGVQRVSSKFVISTVKDSPHPLAGYSIETLLDGQR